MIRIDNIPDNTISLDGVTDETYAKSVQVVSEDNNGHQVPFSVDVVSTGCIDVSPNGADEMLVSIRTEGIENNEFVTFRNANGDKARIDILPNPYIIMEKGYVFKATSKRVSKDGSLKISLSSKMNGGEMGWKCTYDGKPLPYEVEPMSDDGSCTVTIRNGNVSNISGRFTSLFEFTQNESGNVIRALVNNSGDGMSFVKDEKKEASES